MNEQKNTVMRRIEDRNTFSLKFELETLSTEKGVLVKKIRSYRCNLYYLYLMTVIKTCMSF